MCARRRSTCARRYNGRTADELHEETVGNADAREHSGGIERRPMRVRRFMKRKDASENRHEQEVGESRDNQASSLVDFPIHSGDAAERTLMTKTPSTAAGSGRANNPPRTHYREHEKDGAPEVRAAAAHRVHQLMKRLIGRSAVNTLNKLDTGGLIRDARRPPAFWSRQSSPGPAPRRCRRPAR